VSWRDLFARKPEGDEICSFCRRELADVRKLIEGPHDLCICDICVREACESMEKPADGHVEYVACSFCRQPLALVHFAKHDHRICDPCVVLCVEILLEADVEAKLPVARVVRDRPRS
jgi:ATP-dependent protease Clp ATPase subunit